MGVYAWLAIYYLRKHIEKVAFSDKITFHLTKNIKNCAHFKDYLFGKRNEEFTLGGDALVASEVALETASEAAVGLGAFEKSGILILAQDEH